MPLDYGDTLAAMTQSRPSRERDFVRAPLVLWCAFVLVHLLLGLLNMFGGGYPLGDMGVYKYWVDQAVVSNYWVGIDAPWVYPFLAIVPMLIARLAYPVAAAVPALATSTLGVGLYSSSWLSLVLVLDLVAFGVLTGWGRKRNRLVVGWWWVAFLAMLGPIAVGRIDSITVPIAIIGVVFVATRPAVATVALTFAAWIKVWPGALVLAMLVVGGRRWRVAAVGLATSLAIVLVALSFGSGGNVFSFVSQQTARGLQIEAPITTFWMWSAAVDPTRATVYFDNDILTWQVKGVGVDVASSVMTPLLVLAVITVVAIGVVARRRGAEPSALLPPLILALLTAMIGFQKVGSPQFISWLAVPVILGLASHRSGHGPEFRTPAALVLVVAALTQLIYPYLYGGVIGLNPVMLVLLTLRNGMLFVLLGVAIRDMFRSALWRPTPAGRSRADTSLTSTR